MDRDARLISLSGRITNDQAAATRQLIQDYLEQGDTCFVVDLGEVEMIDSSSLGMLVASLRAVAARGGDIKLARAGEQVADLFRLTRLDRVFDMLPTVEAAKAACAAGNGPS